MENFYLIWLTLTALSLIFGGAIIYTLYFFSILRNKNSITKYKEILRSCQNVNSCSDPITIIVSCFNEAKVIARKLENIVDLDYPLEKLEVLVVDDASTDGTGKIAKKKIQELNISGRIITNTTRLGLNRSLNLAMKEAKNNFVCITDSDVILEKKALKNAISVLKGFEGAGGVTGKLLPLFEGQGIAQTSASAYRDFYDKSMLAESSLHSSFPGNGTLFIFDKSKVPSIIPENYGSSDANVAMNVIKSGLRFIYVPDAKIYEYVPENVKEQRLQKVRRAKRLIQVFLHNRDIFLNKKYGIFGKKIFPLKLLMLTLCPVLFFSGTILFILSVLLAQNLALYTFSAISILLITTTILIFKPLRSTLISFVFHQFYLFSGLITSKGKSVYWTIVERK